MSLRFTGTEPSNSHLREMSLCVAFNYPYLTEHMDGTCFIGSEPSYQLFKEIRSIHKAGGQVTAQTLIEKNEDLTGILFSLFPKEFSNKDFYWQFYIELERRCSDV